MKHAFVLLSLACAAIPTTVMAAIPAPPAGYDPEAGPTTWEQCYQLVPEPEVTTCDDYNPPAQPFFASFPWDEPEYMECVRQRCNCSNVTNVDVSAPGYTPSGMYCAAGGFEENGFTYCDQMNECFEDFWRCATDNLMHKHYTAATLNSAEQGAVDNILLHGRTSGEKFEDTDIYRDCRMIQCEAAASRKNCGLITCAPNYTQCYEFIKPPPLPYNHQLCTEGCRAVLMLMAVTVTTFAFAVLCCACCPAPVRVVAPLITKEDSEEDEKKSNKSKSKSGSHSSSKSGHTTRSPSHASE